MTTCHDCKFGPSEAQDGRYCEVVSHVVYHETRACKSFEAKVSIGVIPMGGFVPQSPVKATRTGTNVLRCGACGSLNMGADVCRNCGVKWLMP